MAPTTGPRWTHLLRQSWGQAGRHRRLWGCLPRQACPQDHKATPQEGVLGAGGSSRTWGRDGQHRREGRGQEAGLERPSPLTLSRTTRSCCVHVAEPTEAPGPHPPATDPPGTPSCHPREQRGPCLIRTRGDCFWDFQLDPECVLAQETASEWVPCEVTETAPLTPRASRSSQQTRKHEPQTTDSGKQTFRVNHWQGAASGARDGHSSPRTSSSY